LAAGTDIVWSFNPTTNIWGMATRGAKSAWIQSPGHAIDVASARGCASWAPRNCSARRTAASSGIPAGLAGYTLDPLAVDPGQLRVGE
jgi:hypothetical protein